MPVQRPQAYTQKTKNALAAILPEEQAALLCNIRGAGRSATRNEIIEAYQILFDAVTPLLERIHSEKESNQKVIQESRIAFGREVAGPPSFLGQS